MNSHLPYGWLHFQGHNLIRTYVNNNINSINNQIKMQNIPLQPVQQINNSHPSLLYSEQQHFSRSDSYNFNNQQEGLQSRKTNSKEELELLLNIVEVLAVGHEDIQENSNKKSGEIGMPIQRLDFAMNCILEHTDTFGQTQSIHKIMYLTLKHIKMSALMKRNNSSVLSRSLFLSWLTDASNLYINQLTNAPIVEHQQHTNGHIKPKVPKGKSKGKSKEMYHENGQNKNIMEVFKLNGHHELRNNYYFYLLKMVQNSELQELSVHLQYLMNQFKPEQTILRRIRNLLNLVLKRVYLEKYIAYQMHNQSEKQSYQTGDESKFENYSTFVNNLISEQFKKQILKSVRQDESIDKQQLGVIITYCMGIILGNLSAIQNYCFNNIYLYLKLCAIYVQKDDTLHRSDCLKRAVEHLTKMHSKGNVKYLNSVILTAEHTYFLMLISKGSNPLHFHYVYQQLLELCGSQKIYGYLCGSLYFHYRLVPKQLFSFDSDYETNTHSQMIFSASLYPLQFQQCRQKNKRKNQLYVHQPKFNDNKSLNYSYDSSENQSDSNNDFGIDVPRVNNDINQKCQAQKWQKKNMYNDIKRQQKVLLFKFLLAVVSFYRNVIHETEILRLLKLRDELQCQQEIDTKTTQMDQLIFNIFSIEMPNKIISNERQLEQFKFLSSYASEINVEMYFKDYADNFVRILMQNQEKVSSSSNNFASNRNNSDRFSGKNQNNVQYSV